MNRGNYKATYCRGCSYDLRNLAAGHCPECGLEFDPDDQASVRALPRTFAKWRYPLYFFSVLLILAGVTGTAALVWRSAKVKAHTTEVAAADALKARGFLVSWAKTDTPSWLESRLGLERCSTHVREIQFSRSAVGPSVRADDLKDLGVFVRLETLYLSGATMDEGALGHLRLAVGLKWLNLRSARWPEAWKGDLGLACMTKLERLELSGTAIGDGGLKGLERLSKLKYLWLTDTRIGDESAARFRGLASLEHLSLVKTRISDATLPQLRGLTRLKELSLRSNHGLTDAGLQHLAGLTSLEKLDLDFTGAGDGAVHALRSLPNLRELNVMNARVSDACLEDLKIIPALSDLWILVKPPTRFGLSPRALAELLQARPGLKLTPRWSPEDSEVPLDRRRRE